ncbi:MAG TPA: hypothetical protein PLC67_01275, partial [Spirochaetota bacterium]|nr:hypothetical protein [Spirochaetota bacterium]
VFNPDLSSAYILSEMKSDVFLEVFAGDKFTPLHEKKISSGFLHIIEKAAFAGVVLKIFILVWKEHNGLSSPESENEIFISA